MKTLLVLAGAIALVGCTQTPKTVKSLPAASFAAPSIVAAAPQQQVVTVTPMPAQKTPLPQSPTARHTTPQTGPKEWTPKVAARPWKWIVVHHSATPAGGAAAFDKMHKAKGWDGLGYDFVIGNGTDTRDGQIEVGFRWKQQLTGAHAKTADNQYNDYGIGICLVGNFDIDKPTPAQMQSLARLSSFLMKNYRISQTNVLGHGQTKPTDCPGKFMNIAAMLKLARQNLADATGSTPEPDAHAAVEGELLVPVSR